MELFLIRHAESKNNVRKNDFERSSTNSQSTQKMCYNDIDTTRIATPSQSDQAAVRLQSSGIGAASTPLSTTRTLEECDFGDIGSGTPSDYNFHDLEFTFEKKLSKTGACCPGVFGCCVPTDRRVIIATSEQNGREIRIYSKNNEDILPKNHIPFSYKNPIMSMNNDNVILQRDDKTMIELRSQNPALIQLFCKEINQHRQSIIKFNLMLWKWTHCFQSSIIRMVQKIRNIQQTTKEKQQLQKL